MDRKDNVVYLTDLRLTKHQIKLFGYDHAFKLISLTAIFGIWWIISIVTTI